MPTINRRDFMKRNAVLGGATAAFSIVPRHVLGGQGQVPPSERLNIAGIGVGGKGRWDMRTLRSMSMNIVALCDVDEVYAAPAFNDFPNAKRYRDYRKMLDEMKNIDAVVVATPDHTHAHITLHAMKMGKHVYTQKPMAHSVHEARLLAEAARKYKVATQMGNQGNAGEGVRRMSEWIAAGAVGSIREVHAWTEKPANVWAQGVGRPRETPAVPPTMEWDLWIGPSPERPYHPAYAPFKWRGWWDFGDCALGDMGCHVLNNAVRPLKLGQPRAVEAYSFGSTSETGPLSSIIYYHFPEREGMPPVKLTWYDGGMMPERPRELPNGARMGDNEGVLIVGESGKIVCGCYGDKPRLLPDSLMGEYEKLPETLPRSPGHYKEWTDACKGGQPAGSNFEVALLLTEVVLLGNVAIRAGQRHKQNGYPVRLDWDPGSMTVTNVAEANQYIRSEYRKGWELTL